MRILHTADLHLCSPLTAKLTGEKIRERKGELFATFGRLADKAVELGASAIIMAGDLFDSEDVTLTDCERVLGIIERYPNITYFYACGNHEKRAFADRIREKPKNLIIFGDEWEYYNVKGVRIIGRSRTAPGMFDTLACEGDMKNIVILHGEPRDKSGYGEIGLKEAAEKGIDYLALGHYHTYQVFDLAQNKRAVYPGTPEGRGFDEVGEKGFVLIDTDGREISHTFIPFAKRNLHCIEVDITDVERRIDIENKISASLSGIPSDDLVRVELVGYVEPTEYVDIDIFHSRFVNNYYYFEIKNNTRVRLLPKNYNLDKSLRGEFIRLVNEAVDLTEKDKGLVIMMGISALNGEPFNLWEESK